MADGKKISELTESASIEDAHFFPVSDGTDTKKVAYSTIKNDLIDYSADLAGVISPTVTPTEIAGGHRITVVDIDGTRTFDVMDGERGPQGEQGLKGETGATGYPTDAQVDSAVVDYLTEHPEATTTVQPNSVTDTMLVQTGGVLEVANGASVDVGTLLGTSNLDSFYFEKGNVNAQGGNDNSWRYAVRSRSKSRIVFKTDVVITGDTPTQPTVPVAGYAHSQAFEYDSATQSYKAPTAWAVETTLKAGVEYRLLLDGAIGIASPTAMTLDEVLARFTVVSDIDVRTMRDELDSLLDDSGAIPSYYFADDYLDSKALTVQQKAGVSGVSFGFITDVHTGDSACNSMKLAKYIEDKTSALPFMLFGGDVPETNTGDEAGMYEQAAKWQQMMAQYGKHRVYSCHGNHDYLANVSSGSINLPHWLCWAYAIGYMPDNIHMNDSGSMSYYFDVESKKTRFIVLDQYSGSGRPNFQGYVLMSPADYTWLVDEALNIDDYKVIMLMHQPLNLANDEGSSATLSLLKSVISGFAQHTHVQDSYGAAVVDKDFSTNTSELVCVFAGHVHKDVSSDLDGFLTIVTTSDGLYTTDGYGRSMGTIAEGAFDAVSIDYDNRKIYCTRIGAGSDREFSY